MVAIGMLLRFLVRRTRLRDSSKFAPAARWLEKEGVAPVGKDETMGAWEELLVERMDLAEATGSCATQKHLVASFADKVVNEGVKP